MRLLPLSLSLPSLLQLSSVTSSVAFSRAGTSWNRGISSRFGTCGSSSSQCCQHLGTTLDRHRMRIPWLTCVACAGFGFCCVPVSRLRCSRLWPSFASSVAAWWLIEPLPPCIFCSIAPQSFQTRCAFKTLTPAIAESFEKGRWHQARGMMRRCRQGRRGGKRAQARKGKADAGSTKGQELDDDPSGCARSALRGTHAGRSNFPRCRLSHLASLTPAACR
jgi:hypothetical protein